MAIFVYTDLPRNTKMIVRHKKSSFRNLEFDINILPQICLEYSRNIKISEYLKIERCIQGDKLELVERNLSFSTLI